MERDDGPRDAKNSRGGKKPLTGATLGIHTVTETRFANGASLPMTGGGLQSARHPARHLSSPLVVGRRHEIQCRCRRWCRCGRTRKGPGDWAPSRARIDDPDLHPVSVGSRGDQRSTTTMWQSWDGSFRQASWQPSNSLWLTLTRTAILLIHLHSCFTTKTVM